MVFILVSDGKTKNGIDGLVINIFAGAEFVPEDVENIARPQRIGPASDNGQFVAAVMNLDIEGLFDQVKMGVLAAEQGGKKAVIFEYDAFLGEVFGYNAGPPENIL